MTRNQNMDGGVRAIIDFWFREIGPDRWWTRSAATDDAIRSRFLPLWEEWRRRPAGAFLSSPEQALAAILLFDQFARNMFRGDARAFATDGLAREIADGANARGFDSKLTPQQRAFLYMPFMHSEDLSDQDRAVQLFETLRLHDQVEYAHRHREIIRRFGRFPARNAVLGRPDRASEADAIAETKDW